jgi:hypothetical protein
MLSLLKATLSSIFLQFGKVLFSEAMVKWLIIKGLDWLVKITPTKFDDEALKRFKESLK